MKTLTTYQKLLYLEFLKNGAFDLKNLEEFTDELEFTFKNTNKNTLFYCEDQKEINLTDYLGNTIKVSDKSRLLFSSYNL